MAALAAVVEAIGSSVNDAVAVGSPTDASPLDDEGVSVVVVQAVEPTDEATDDTVAAAATAAAAAAVVSASSGMQQRGGDRSSRCSPAATTPSGEFKSPGATRGD